MGGLKLSAIELSDPQGKELRRHPGTHPEIMQGVIRHWQFPTKLNEFKAHFNMHRQLSLTIYCRAGKHRSISFTLAIEHILKTEFNLQPEIDYRGSWWVGRECLRGHCAACVSQARSSILAEALAIWRSL